MPSSLRKTLLVLAAGAAAAFVGPAAAAASCPGEGSPSTALTDTELEQSILCLVNERRTGSGLPGLRAETRLEAAATRHSEDMVRRSYFGHTSPSGVEFVDRVLDTGYMSKARAWLVGENLAWGTGALSAPGSIVDSWMASPPHRANILRARFREAGIGAVRGTPSDPAALGGVTITTEYGFRSGKAKREARHRRIRRR